MLINDDSSIFEIDWTIPNYPVQLFKYDLGQLWSSGKYYNIKNSFSIDFSDKYIIINKE